MSYTSVPFKAWHLGWILDRGDSLGGAPTVSADALAHIEQLKSRTLVAPDGSPILCGGVIPAWAGRCSLWSVLSVDSGPHMMAVTRHTRAFINEVQGRIETSVRCDFMAGHRWVRMLGFYVETPVMKRYGPEGEDHSLYVRFN